MSDTFNGYHVWLGIPLAEQPPNHYRLLGITIFETDSDVIDHAADRQMAHLRTFQSGPHGSLSQQLLNELSAARLCLLTAAKKAAYDEQLRAKVAAAAPKVTPMPVGMAVPIAQPIVKAAANSVPRAMPQLPRATPAKAAAPEKGRGAMAKTDELDEIELDIEPVRPAPRLTRSLDSSPLDDELDIGAAPMLPPLRTRRRVGRAPAWQQPAIVGVLAAVVVCGFMLLYYILPKMLPSTETLKQLMSDPLATPEPSKPGSASPKRDGVPAPAPPATPAP